MKKSYTVKNKVTGFTFLLKKEICDELVINEPFNFEVLDKDYVSPIKEVEETTVYSKIVGTDEEESEEDEMNQVQDEDEQELNKMTVPELKAYAAKLNIDIKSLTRKDDIIERILIMSKELSNETETEQVTVSINDDDDDQEDEQNNIADSVIEEE